MNTKINKLLTYLGLFLSIFFLIIAVSNHPLKAQDHFYTWVEESHNQAGEIVSITRYFDWYLVTARNNWGRRRTENYQILVPPGYVYSHHWVRTDPESERGYLTVTKIREGKRYKGIRCNALVTSQGFWGSEGYLKGYCRLLVKPIGTDK